MKSKIFVGLIFFSLLFLSVLIGVKDLSFSQLLKGDGETLFLIFTTRLPRTISLVLAGAALSVCGLVMQQLTQNKFVSPTTAGTMDSARLGIVFVMLFLPQASPLQKTAVAFLFAFLGTGLFLMVARLLPGKNSLLLPLVGVMFGNIVGSMATFLAYEKDLVQNMASWLQGNFALVMKGNYELLYLLLPAGVLLYFFAYAFTIVGLGEDLARNVGINYQKMQLLGLLLVALSSALVLLLVGSIPFLGVVIPNLVAYFYGDHLQKNLGKTALYGSLFLLVCDILARLIIFPYELSVSVVVGVIGSGLFLGLLLKGTRTVV